MLRPILRPISWGILLLGVLVGLCARMSSLTARRRPGYRYSFPRDHFEHPDFRTEWWYYTGNLRDSGGRRFGFELVFFRQGQRRGATENRSAWRIDDLYLAHLALTDIDNKKFYKSQRLNRAGPGVAGARFAERRVWNGNWSARWEGDRQVLEAIGGRVSLPAGPQSRSSRRSSMESAESARRAPGPARPRTTFPCPACWFRAS